MDLPFQVATLRQQKITKLYDKKKYMNKNWGARTNQLIATDSVTGAAMLLLRAC